MIFAAHWRWFEEIFNESLGEWWPGCGFPPSRPLSFVLGLWCFSECLAWAARVRIRIKGQEARSSLY